MAKQQLVKRKHPSFWKKNRDTIIVSIGLSIADKIMTRLIEAVGKYIKFLMDILF